MYALAVLDYLFRFLESLSFVGHIYFDRIFDKKKIILSKERNVIWKVMRFLEGSKSGMFR